MSDGFESLIHGDVDLHSAHHAERDGYVQRSSEKATRSRE